MYRVGREQVIEAIPVKRAGVRFFVSRDPQGRYFIVRGDGLGICDSRGCSRVAKIDKSAPKYRDGEIAARTDERISELEARPKINILRTGSSEAGDKGAATDRAARAAMDPTSLVQVAKWFSEALPNLRGWGSVLSSLGSSYRGIGVASTERVRFCRESLANPPAQIAASGDAEVDAAVSSLRSENALEALRICTTENALSAQVLIVQATEASRRLDRRLRDLGIVVP